MEDFLSTFSSIFTNYGVKTFIIVFLTIILVNIIKKAIIKKATNYAQAHNCDKSIITCYITYIVLIIVFVLNLLYELVVTKFNFTLINWTNYVYSSFTLASISIGTFETIKKQIQGFTARKQLSQNTINDNINTKKTDSCNLVVEKAKTITQQNKTTTQQNKRIL